MQLFSAAPCNQKQQRRTQSRQKISVTTTHPFVKFMRLTTITLGLSFIPPESERANIAHFYKKKQKSTQNLQNWQRKHSFRNKIAQSHQQKSQCRTRKNITEKGKELFVLKHLHTFVSKCRKRGESAAKSGSQEKKPWPILSVPFA